MTRTLKKKKVRRYSTGTKVDVDKSRIELEKILAKHGATQRQVTVDDEAGKAQIVFRLDQRMIRLNMRSERDCLPDPGKSDFNQDVHCPRGWNTWTVKRREEWVEAETEQCDREAWRRLVLITKARFELIADDPEQVERQFLADIMLPDGSTVYEGMKQQLEDSYTTGEMPKLLAAATED